MTELASVLARVLGSGAGGGIPQWNCGCRLCRLARAGDPRIRPATQAGLAVSANGEDWVLVGASPDLRQQINQNSVLWPQEQGRNSPIRSVVLTGGDIDAIAGLLVMRERQPFTVFAPQPVLDVLHSNNVFNVLDPALVRRQVMAPNEPIECAPGVVVTLLPMPGKVPLYQETQGASVAEPGPAFAALIEAGGRRLVVAIACAQITEAVQAHLRRADVVFFDGTMFTDDEMRAAGLGEKTSRRMGHVPIAGPDGSLAQLAQLSARCIYLHINNTNPILLSDSPERREVEAAGLEVAFDGMEVRL